MQSEKMMRTRNNRMLGFENVNLSSFGYETNAKWQASKKTR
jgi:hypothetical protein